MLDQRSLQTKHFDPSGQAGKTVGWKILDFIFAHVVVNFGEMSAVDSFYILAGGNLKLI